VRLNASRIVTFSVVLSLFAVLALFTASHINAADPDQPPPVGSKTGVQRPVAAEGSAKKAAPTRPLSYPEIVEANFAKWDKDQDGQLSVKEINANEVGGRDFHRVQ
jgi:hypothetical protein